MPYKSVAEAEARNPGIKKLPGHAKRVWTSAFNSAKGGGADDSSAARIAWFAVKNAGYHKKGERWVKMTEDVLKATIAIDGDNIAFGIPFSKINVKDRTVEGFATLDNIDKVGEVVDFTASQEAFKTWIGNIREMHAPIAVGKAIDISEKKYTDESGNSYNGVWVKSRISKGAEDTWQKVLDGTLSGYSVGGKVLERRPDIVKPVNDDKYSVRNIMRITKYHLAELSVVDNPMNPLTVFQDISKGATLLKLEDDELTVGDAIIENRALFYCEPCDVAKTDNIEATTIECVSCDAMMIKIGEVSEVLGVSDLKKMVDEFKLNKAGDVYTEDISGSEMIQNPDKYVVTEDFDMTGGTNQTEIYNKETNQFEMTEVSPTPKIENANPELITQTSLPEGGPQQGAMKAEGNKDSYDGLKEAAEKILEVLKGRTKSNDEVQYKKIYDDEEVAFFEALTEEDLYKAITNASKTPPKGKPTNRSQYADPANYKYPIDSSARVRAAMVYFNHPNQRQAGGYSMSQWAAIGRKIASAANKAFGSGHKFSGGRVVGPNTSNDAKKADLVLKLQKDSSGNIVEMLRTIFPLLHTKDASNDKGGEISGLENYEQVLEKIADIFEVAKREAEEVLKAFAGVQDLNSEDGAGKTVGSDPGEAGVGTSNANDGGATLNAVEVTVAKETALPAADVGPEKVTPDAISTDGVGADVGTNDFTPANVLPHADLGAAEQPEDLKKVIADYFDDKFSELAKRIDAIENSGGGKKSSEVNTEDLVKAETSDSIWGGAFYSDEWDK
jgi:cation transport regulator ChaB